MTVTDEQLIAYRAGQLDPLSDAALEELLMVDQSLRQRLGLLASPLRLDAVLADVHHTIDQPPAGRLERLTQWFGVPEPAARLAGATPALTRSWIWGIVGIALFSLTLSADATRGEQRFLAYLLLAPILVIAAVAAAYGRSTDPAHEVTIAAPTSGAKLLLWRVLAVAPTAVLVNLVIGLMLRAGRFSFAWILPAVACTMATLALSTSISVRRAASIVAGGYVLLVGAIAAVATDNLVAFRPAGQLAAAAIAVAATAVLLMRRDHLEEAVTW